MFSFELGNPDFNELEKKQIMSVQNIGPVGSTKLQETRKKKKTVKWEENYYICVF